MSDPSSIYEHLERIAASTDSDPGVAISGARALIEATTKLVLAELGEAYDEKADVPALVKAAQKALALHPDSLAPTRPEAFPFGDELLLDPLLPKALALLAGVLLLLLLIISPSRSTKPSTSRVAASSESISS
jgi:predicted RNA-binding Zn ribbon-like protein